MCMIVDTNRIGLFLQDPPNEDTQPIHSWMRRGLGTIVYSTGSVFARELKPRARRRFLEWTRAGWAKPIPADEFEDDERALWRSGLMKSDDAHVLALARRSGARLLYTCDGDLIDDFKNKQLIDQPRGKIYSRATNENLLTASVCRR